jgi:hypothetical protein
MVVPVPVPVPVPVTVLVTWGCVEMPSAQRT